MTGIGDKLGRGAALVMAAKALSVAFAAGAAKRDSERILPVGEMAELRSAGLQAARVPAAYGGPDLGFRELAELMIWLGAGDPNIAQAVQPHFVLLDMLRLFGTEAQKQRYFGAVVGGHIITNAYAERGTGIVGQITTTLKPDGNGYRLNGTKFYCTGSLVAEQFYVLIGTEGDGRTIAIVPGDREGLTIHDDWDAMGQRTTASGTVEFDHVAVAADEVIAAEAIWRERSHVGALAQMLHAAIDAGIAKAALADAIDYAQNRARPVLESGVTRASDDPYVMSAVGEMRVAASVAEVMVLNAGEALDRTVAAQTAGDSTDAVTRLLEKASIAVAEAKIASTQSSLAVSETMFTVSGASASLSTQNLDRHWRNARTHTIHDPVSYKYKIVSDYLLNGRPPPVGTRY